MLVDHTDVITDIKQTTSKQNNNTQTNKHKKYDLITDLFVFLFYSL